MATTDSRHYARLSSNVDRFHPARVSISDASGVHGTNENVAIDAVASAVAIQRSLVEACAAP